MKRGEVAMEIFDPPKTPFEVRLRTRILGYRQEQAIRFIRQCEEAGCTVSLNDIAAALNLDGKGHAWNIVDRLQRRGEVYRDDQRRLRSRSA